MLMSVSRLCPVCIRETHHSRAWSRVFWCQNSLKLQKRTESSCVYPGVFSMIGGQEVVFYGPYKDGVLVTVCGRVLSFPDCWKKCRMSDQARDALHKDYVSHFVGSLGVCYVIYCTFVYKCGHAIQSSALVILVPT